ncbi:MAG: discoidin domain-containing protein [Bifidobacteriaceae bacterium]|jgi:chondroitin AC lyase|nr:discoidin domain-containing protein [Bifidobacteriaceae bacterium]
MSIRRFHPTRRGGGGAIRRGLALGAAAAVAAAGALAGATPAAAAIEDDIAQVAARLQAHYIGLGDDILIANGIYLAQMSNALDYAESINANGSWPDVNYADRTSSANGAVWKPYIALYRMLAMAQAYIDPPQPGYQDPGLIEALNAALRYWDSVKPSCANWWENEVGKAMAMGRLAIMVGGELDADALAIARSHTYDGSKVSSSTGANGAWYLENALLRAVSEANGAKIATYAARLAGLLTVNTSASCTADGDVQVDSSYYAHGCQLYSEGYGMDLFKSVAIWAEALDGTSLAFSRDQLDLIANYILDGTRWLIRGEVGTLYVGFRPLKTFEGVTSYASEFLTPLAKMVAADEANAAAYQALRDSILGQRRDNGVVGDKYFWRGEFSSHQRQDYGIVTRVNSSRMVGSEFRLSSVDAEVGNAIAWNAAGVTAISVNNREYDDTLPAFDWFHYPGTTAPYVKEVTRASGSNGGSFTGGISDGVHGATVLTLNRASTQAKKSYYYFDDEMVALGAGIASANAAAVHTTINQAASKDNASLGGQALEFGVGDLSAEGATWAYNDEIGYVFAADAGVKASNKTQQGRWQGEDWVEKDVFTLYFDHGAQPAGAGYEYIVLPAQTPEAVEDYAADPAVEILRNDATIQAVRHAELGLTMATFYAAGTLDLGGGRSLRLSAPAVVMLDESGEQPTARVANPDTAGLVIGAVLSDAASALSAQATTPGGAYLGASVGLEFEDVIAAEAITVTGPDAITVPGGSAQYTAELVPEQATTGVVWSVAALDGGATLVAKISPDGVLTAAKNGKVVVRAAAADGSGVCGEKLVTISSQTQAFLSVGKPVEVSGATNPNLGPLAVDGVLTTRWTSEKTTGATPWIYVDLGNPADISLIQVAWEGGNATQYKIQVSNDAETWRDVHEFNVATGAQTNTVPSAALPGQAYRYVKLQVVKLTRDSWGANVFEFTIDGSYEITQPVESFAVSGPGGSLALERPNHGLQMQAVASPADATDPRAEWFVYDQDGAETAAAEITATGVLTASDNGVYLVVARSVDGSGVEGSCLVAVTNQDLPNLALNKTITAYRSAAAYGANKANDGDRTTRWASESTAAGDITVDLGVVAPVNSVALYWETAYATDYTVKVRASSAEEWQTVCAVDDGQPGLRDCDFDAVPARYAAVSMTSFATGYGGSLWEFEVYGPALGLAFDLNGLGELVAGLNAPAERSAVYGEAVGDLPELDLGEEYEFTGWNTAPDGTGGAYTATTVFGAVAPVRLYAQYEAVATGPEPLALSATTGVKCVAGKAYLTVTAYNNSDVAASLTLTTPYGVKVFGSVAPGKAGFHSFTTRLASYSGVAVSVTGEGVAEPARTGVALAVHATASCG